MITAIVDEKNFQAEFTRIVSRAKRPRAVMAAVGREGQQQLVKRFRAKDRNEPNRLGGPRSHFWNEIADSVQSPVITEAGGTLAGLQARISITDPRLAQKVFGGVIRAKNVRMLTIPQTSEAYGRTAQTFEHETGLKLFLIKHSGFAALAAKFSSGGIVIEYILKASVNQPSDPSALPDMGPGSEFNRALLARAQSVVDRENQQANQ